MGVARLVPPTLWAALPTKTNAPRLLPLAIAATSGTQRAVPLGVPVW